MAAVLVLCAVVPAVGDARAAKAISPCREANVHPSATNIRAADAATLCLVNRMRLAHGLRPLSPNRELDQVAASQVTSMVRWDYFADDRPTGQTPLSLVAATRYRGHAAQVAVGQNIAWGTGRRMTPLRIVAEWMASPPHREIMLDAEFRNVGVAVTPAVPAMLHAGSHGATYALEVGVRHVTY